jgi:2-phosphosulfolactate phosphatase
VAGADPFSQAGAAVRFDWGHEGAQRLAAVCSVVVIVDVLSFTTAVSVAVDRGATVLPFRWRDRRAGAFARREGAVLAGARGSHGPSLSTASLMGLEPGTRLVLPSPNGSTCCVIAAEAGATVVAGSLRNRSSVVAWLRERIARLPQGDDRTAVAVIAAGEQWPSGALRPALEDLLGAGSILAGLDGRLLSAEARVAVAAWLGVEPDLAAVVADSASGRELIGGGWADDVRIAVELDASSAVPVLRDGAFARDAATGETRP